jgi:hypothetical protein
MSVGVHNLFANPAWVGGLHQDPSSSHSLINAFDPAITTTSAFSSSYGYGHQCSNTLAQYNSKEACEAVSGYTWHGGAPGTINVDAFDSNAAAGDRITFSSTVTDGNYISSYRSVLTLTQYHDASTSASTLTGEFDGPVASGATVVSHKTHYPRWISSPRDTEVHKDSVIKLIAQSSYDATKHSFYGGGTQFRWLMVNRLHIVNPSTIRPRTHATDPFGYRTIYVNGMSSPQIFTTSSAKNGEAQGGDPGVDVLNVSTPNASTCVLEIGPFGSMFNGRNNNMAYPEKLGAWWWCEQLLLDDEDQIQMVLQTPLFFLEVSD